MGNLLGQVPGDPIKKETVVNELRIEGDFGCQFCDGYSDEATQIGDTVQWTCMDCGRVSTMRALF